MSRANWNVRFSVPDVLPRPLRDRAEMVLGNSVKPHFSLLSDFHEDDDRQVSGASMEDGEWAVGTLIDSHHRPYIMTPVKSLSQRRQELLSPFCKTDWKRTHRLETIKRHDRPKTPHQRIMDSEYVVQNMKNALTKQFEHLDPFELRNVMETKLKKINRFR